MKNIKLGMIAAMSYPPTKASGIRVRNELQALSEKNISARLYCCPPGPSHEIMNLVEIFRTPTQHDSSDYFKYYKWSRRLKIIWQLSNMAAKDIAKDKINILHVHTPEGLLISIFARLLAFKNIPVVADIHGPFVEELVHYKMIPNSYLIRFLFKFVEKFVFYFANTVLATSSGLLKYLEMNISRNKLVLLSDYVFLSRFKPSDKNLTLRDSLTDRNKTIVMYLGTLKDYQGVDDLLKAYKVILNSNNDAQLVIVGAGGLGVDYYRNIAKNLNIADKVIFTGHVPHDSVPQYLNIADILVSPRKNTEVTQKGFVSQLPEYLALEKVIVATNISDCDLMLSQNAGSIAEANNYEDLADKILYLLKNKTKWPEYQYNAKLMAQQYSWEYNSEKLIDIYKNLLNLPTGSTKSSL